MRAVALAPVLFIVAVSAGWSGGVEVSGSVSSISSRVAAEHPKPGRILTAGTTVAFTVSKGKRPTALARGLATSPA